MPHLAFIKPGRYDHVVGKVRQRDEKYRAGIAKEANRRTRTDAPWPAQHPRCGICGRRYVRGGHGRNDRMMCDGARRYMCWNAMTVDGPQLAQAVADELRHPIEQIPYFVSLTLIPRFTRWKRDRLHKSRSRPPMNTDESRPRLSRSGRLKAVISIESCVK